MSQPATSVAAYQAIQPTAPSLRQQVFDFLQGQVDGATDEEIQKALAIGPQTESPRRRELVQKGFVVDSGKTRATSAGRQAIIWRIV